MGVRITDGHRYIAKSQHRFPRSSSCPTLRGNAVAKAARLTWEQRSVSHPAPPPDTQSKVSSLLENAVYNLSHVMAEFQQGVMAKDYTDGDLAARNGHLHIAKNVAVRFTIEAMELAAAQGHLEMVIFLHETRREGTTVNAMDLAATFGRLEVVRWLHEHRQEGCTTRAMDGAARNGHLGVSLNFVGSSIIILVPVLDD